jgi:hypothetical protein
MTIEGSMRYANAHLLKGGWKIWLHISPIAKLDDRKGMPFGTW